MSGRTNLKGLEFSVSEEWSKIKNKSPQISFVPEFAMLPNDIIYMKAIGRKAVYRAVQEDSKGRLNYECVECNSEIRLIQKPPILMQGLEETPYELIPYCPKCENEYLLKYSKTPFEPKPR